MINEWSEFTTDDLRVLAMRGRLPLAELRRELELRAALERGAELERAQLERAAPAPAARPVARRGDDEDQGDDDEDLAPLPKASDTKKGKR
jgi:hypothetical protein